jgi:Fe2+ or Zn2+ uptake regulation protein
MNQLDLFHLPDVRNMIGPVYFNTTSKKGDELEKARVRASGQTEAVLKLFQNHPNTTFSVWEVHFRLGQQYSKSWIGRAITTLTDAGHLEKCEKRRNGPYNENSYTWRLSK